MRWANTVNFMKTFNLTIGKIFKIHWMLLVIQHLKAILVNRRLTRPKLVMRNSKNRVKIGSFHVTAYEQYKLIYLATLLVLLVFAYTFYLAK
jgi:hypothetical protein